MLFNQKKSFSSRILLAFIHFLCCFSFAWLFLSPSSFVLAAADDIAIHIAGSGNSSLLTMEGMWLGENITLTISGKSTYNWSSTLNSTCFANAVAGRNAAWTQRDCQNNSICQNETDVVDASAFEWVPARSPAPATSTTTTVMLRLKRALYFGYRDDGGAATGLYNDSIRFTFTAASGCFSGSPTGLPLEVKIPIRGYQSSSFASAVSAASTELDIRLRANKIVFSVIYSSFLQSSCFSLSLPPGITGSWTSSFPAIEAEYTLNQNATYNISSTAQIQVTFFAASSEVGVLKTYYSGIQIPNPVAFNFPIYSIVGPRTPCVVSGSNDIFEADLRAGTGPVIYVTLADTSKDQFIPNWNSAQQAAFVALARLPSRVLVAVAAVNTTTLTLTFLVTSPISTFEVDAAEMITMRVPDRQLQSAEVGCGTFAVNIKASRGIVVGKEYPTRTEVQIMTQSILLHFYLAHDEFLPTATVVTNVTQEESGFVSPDAEDSGFAATLASGVVVTVINSTYATVLIPSSLDYNIPTKVTEIINISFPGSAMRSGLAPVMALNNTVNITSVPVVCAAYFRSTGIPTIASESLWTNGAELVLQLEGDKWTATPGAELIWTKSHPRVEGLVKANASVEGYSYEDLTNAYAPVELFNYSTVNITPRVASVRMIPLRGLVQQFDERVTVSQLRSLIRGLPVVDEPSFKISAVLPSSIQITFSGVVEHVNGVPEAEIRKGFVLYLNTSYQVFPLATNNNGHDLFLGQTSLTSILRKCKSGRGGNSTREWWKYNITCGPELFNDFDITQTERINIVVPNSFFFGSIKPSAVFTSRFDIIASPNVGCFFATEIKISERDVRSGDVRLDFLVQATDDFQSKAVLDTLPINSAITNSHAKSGYPLGLKFGNTLRGDLVSFGLLKNESYDITTPDLVTISLNRHFFASGESCTSSLNFTVVVSPGFGNVTFRNDTTNIQSDDIKTKPIYFSIFFTEEQLSPWVIANGSFEVTIYGVSKTGSPNPEGASGMVQNYGWGAKVYRNTDTTTTMTTTTMTTTTTTTTLAPGQNSTSSPGGSGGSSSAGGAVTRIWHRFDGVLPAQPNYRISSDENIYFQVPESVVASGLSPDLFPNSIAVRPAASGIRVTFRDALRQSFNATVVEANDIFTVNESLIVRGGLEIDLELLEDMWVNNVTAFKVMRQKVRRERASGAPLAPFLDTGDLTQIFNLSQFVLTSNSTLRIITSPDSTYNAMEDEIFTLFFEPSSTVTGFAPRRGNVTWRVAPETPFVTATGPALFIGSTDFIEGGAFVEIVLHNDNFIISNLVNSKLCRFNNASDDACAIDLKNDNLRYIRLTLFRRIDTVVERNTTFPIQIPKDAIMANSTLNVVNLVVFRQRGVAAVSLPGSPLTFGESFVRAGSLPPFVISLYGDVFVATLGDIAAAISASVQCTTVSSSSSSSSSTADPFGFCGRAPVLFAANKVNKINSRTVSVSMQPDPDFDISEVQKVNVTLAAKSVVSGLIPIGFLILTIVPEAGTYTFSASKTTVTTAEVSRDPNFAVDVTLTLTSERFIADPTMALVTAATSTQSVAAEANGFAKHKLSMFTKAQVSANGRTAKLTMIGNKDFALLRAETVTFFVDRAAIISAYVPQPEDIVKPRTITIQMSGGELSMSTPTYVAADIFSSGTFNISIHSTQSWDLYAISKSFVGGAALSAVMNSDRSAAAEPNGFSALKDVMLPKESLIGKQTLVLMFRAAPTYKLNADEVITLSVPASWTSNGHDPFPSTFSVTVSHYSTNELSQGSLFFYIPANVPVSAFAPALAAFAGLSPELVKVLSSPLYPRGNGRYRVVTVLFNDMSNRPATQAVSFVRNSDSNLLRSVLNVSAVLAPEEVAALTDQQLDIKLGLRAEVIYVGRERSTWWVYVAVAFTVLLIICGLVFYRRTRNRFMNLNASAVRSFKISGGPSPDNNNNNNVQDGNYAAENPLLALQQEEEEEEMLAGLFERYGKKSARGEGLFLNSSIMVSGLRSSPSRMSRNEVDDMLGVHFKNISNNNSIGNNNNNTNTKNGNMNGSIGVQDIKNNNNHSSSTRSVNSHSSVAAHHHGKNTAADDLTNMTSSSLIEQNKELRFLGDDRGPAVIDEYEVNLGQPVPSLSSRVKAFQSKKVDVDETVAARQPAHIFGVAGREVPGAQTQQRRRYLRAGQYDEDHVAPADRFVEELDGLSVFPPGESMSSRLLNHWRVKARKELDKNDPYSHL